VLLQSVIAIDRGALEAEGRIK